MKQTVIALLLLTGLLLFSISCEKNTCALSEDLLLMVEDMEKAITLQDVTLTAQCAEREWDAWINAEEVLKLYLSHTHIERIRDQLINVSAASHEKDLKKLAFYVKALRHELMELQKMESLQLESLL